MAVFKAVVAYGEPPIVWGLHCDFVVAQGGQVPYFPVLWGVREADLVGVGWVGLFWMWWAVALRSWLAARSAVISSGRMPLVSHFITTFMFFGLSPGRCSMELAWRPGLGAFAGGLLFLGSGF